MPLTLIKPDGLDALSLADLTDVADALSPSSGQVLTFNGTYWASSTPSAGSAPITHDSFDWTLGAARVLSLPNNWDGTEWSFATAGGSSTISPITISIANATASSITGVVIVSVSIVWSSMDPTATAEGEMVNSAILTRVSTLGGITGAADVIDSQQPVYRPIRLKSGAAGNDFTETFTLHGKLVVPAGGRNIYLHPGGAAVLDAALTGASGCSILTPHVTFIGG